VLGPFEKNGSRKRGKEKRELGGGGGQEKNMRQGGGVGHGKQQKSGQKKTNLR